MNSWKTKRALELVKEMSATERKQLDDYLIGAIRDDVMSKRSQYKLSLMADYISSAEDLRKNWGKMQGVSTGFPSLDRLTKGFVGGETIVITGATSSGKTTLAVNIAVKAAIRAVPVLFVTLEMTKPQLTARCMMTSDRFEEAASFLVYQESQEMDWSSIDGLIGAAVKQMGVEMVVIDHLHYFTRELNNVAEDLGRITKEFKKNAVSHDIPIVIIAHARKGDGMDINDIRGSSYIAQDADIVLHTQRPPETDKYILVKISKNRNRGFNPEDDTIGFGFDGAKLTDPLQVEKGPF